MDLNDSALSALINYCEDGMVILSAEGKPIYVSPSVEKILGYTQEEALQLDLLSLAHPDDIIPASIVMQEALSKPGVAIKGHIGRMRHKDGSWRWVDATVTNMLHHPDINGLIDVFHDVTDTHLAYEKLEHSNRLYAFISQINQIIVRAKNEEELFTEACDVALAYGKFSAAMISILNTAKDNTISVVATAGLPAEDLELFRDYAYSSNGLQGRVLHTGQYYICNNIAEDNDLADWQVYAASRGFKSCMVLPLKKQGEVIGTYTIQAAEVHFFNDEILALLVEATDDISFALDVFEKERQRLIIDQKLKNSEARLNEAQAIAQVGSWLTDLRDLSVTWSDETYRIFETDTNGFDGKHATFMKYVHPDDVAKVDAAFVGSLNTSTPNAIEHRIITGKGNVRVVIEHWQVYTDEDGVAVQAIGTCQDITERKKIEKQLLQSEAFNKGILSSIGSHIAVVNKEGTLITVNKAWDDFAEQNGATVMERVSVGSNYFDVCQRAAAEGEQTTDVVLAGMKAVLNKEQHTFEFEYPCHSPTEHRWFLLRAVQFGADDDKIVCSHIDITERKKAEQALVKSESNLQAVLENTDATIYSLDRDLRYITFNQQLKNSLKAAYGIDVKIGDKVYEFLKWLEPEEAKFWEGIYTRALNGELVKFEKEFSIGDFYSCISFSIYPIVENNEIIGLSCFGLDTTKKREAEKQKEKITEELIQRNKDLEQFSYVISHNLRSPVANILGLAELMEHEGTNEAEKELMMEHLTHSVKKLDTVIKDLNYVLQVKNHINERKDRIVFSELLHDVKHSIINLYSREDAQIISDFSAIDEYRSLKSYWYSIFFNLISNSIKYGRAGVKPVIHVTSSIIDDKLVLVFEDNGLGIDIKKYGDQIFGLYQRFHYDIEGKGLGLYMVKTQVETLGGKITIDSVVGTGTTFRIEFNIDHSAVVS